MRHRSYSQFGRTTGFILLLLLMSQTPLNGWYAENHKRISRAGLQQLPEWEQAWLGASLDSLSQYFCWWPDAYNDLNHDNGFVTKRNLNFGEYVRLPLLNNLVPWHDTDDADAAGCFYLVATVMHNTIEDLQKDNVMRAARHMGPLLHFFEDNACPVHVIDDKYLAMRYPPPDHIQAKDLHRTVEEPTFELSIEGYTPKLLGESIVEAANAVYPRFLENRQNARIQAGHILHAIYVDDRATADTHRANAARPAAQLIADVVHTICTLAKTY
jgi:hypothetical protein